MGHRGEVHVVSGNPDEVAAQLAAYADVGVRHMQLNFLDFPRTDSLDLFMAKSSRASIEQARKVARTAYRG